MYECIANAKEIVKDGEIDSAKMISHLDQTLKDPVWLPIVKKAAVGCLESTTTKAAEIKKLFTSTPFNIKPEECNINTMAFIECTKTAAFVACPKNLWNDSKRCNDVKNFVLRCNNDIENIQLLVSSLSK